MRFELPELHEALRDTLRRFVEKGDVSRFDELELWGLMLPEACGGAEMDALAYVVVLESLAELSPALAHRFALHAGPASAAMLEAKLDPSTLAEGTLATWTDGARAPRSTWLVVETDALRIYEGARWTPAPLMALDEAELSSFEVAEPVASAKTSPRVRALADLGMAACQVGAAQAALRAARAYAKERKQFGRPIADFQAIQWKIADATTELDAAQLLVRAAASDLKKAAQARVFAGVVANRAASEALQIHGGYGYTREYPVERWLRAIRIWSADPDAARLRADG